MQHVNDDILLADQGTFHHTLALGMHNGTQCRFIMGIGQCNTLFQVLTQYIGFQFFKIRKHVFFLRIFILIPSIYFTIFTCSLYTSRTVKTTKYMRFLLFFPQ